MQDYTALFAYAQNALRRSLSALRKAFLVLGKALTSAAKALHRFAKAHRRARLGLAETAGGVLVVTGIAQWSVPSALIVGGLAIMAAIEVRS